MTDKGEPNPEDEALEKLIGDLDRLPKVPEPDEDMDERLARLEARADAMKQRRENDQKESARKVSLDRESTKGLGMGLSIAYALIGLPLVGAAVGWYLDRQLKTEMWKGIFVVGGIVLAIAYTMLVLNRDNRDGKK